MATTLIALPVGYQNANHDALIISIVTIFSVLSFSALIMRLASKRIKRVGLDWDDYLVITSWVSTVTWGIELRPAALIWKLGCYTGAEYRCCIRYVPASMNCPRPKKTQIFIKHSAPQVLNLVGWVATPSPSVLPK